MALGVFTPRAIPLTIIDMSKVKQALIETLLGRVRVDLQDATMAALETSAGAKDESMKSDGKYDTRGIEAGQLAGAQLRRVEELKLEIQMLEEMPVRDFDRDEEIALGALVELEHKGQTRRYFLCSTAGGTLLESAGQAVLVISVFSPLGDAALGLKLGESFELETPQARREYVVRSIA